MGEADEVEQLMQEALSGSRDTKAAEDPYDDDDEADDLKQLMQEALAELRDIKAVEDHHDVDEAGNTTHVAAPHPTESSAPEEGHGDQLGPEHADVV